MSDSAPKRQGLGIDTLLAHAGGDPRERHGAVNPPVYRASTFLFETAAEWEASRDHKRRFDVIRYGQLATPTTVAFEEAIATLEGGFRAMLLPSGLAAVTVSLQALVRSGDHILIADTVYPPTRIFCDTTLKRFGVETTYYDPLIGGEIAAAFRPNTRLVFLESPGSMTFEIQDVPAICAAARARGIHTLLDNSWATPYFFPAFDRGVDVSILAATKYIGGHSDVMMGTVTTTESLYEPIRSAVAELGFCVSSDDAYLALRGLRTLGVRLERHERSAVKVAAWLKSRPEVKRVLHPALADAPGHALWRRDFLGASGLFGVELHETAKAHLDRMLDALELFGMGASFGGFESLLIPVDPRPFRTATRWTHDGPLIRIHVGLEDPDDLIADLARAMDRLGA
jgi:cystathionine beta-lyase